jgi:uncharacterized membrane protein
MPNSGSEALDKGRVEAFSDGVLAVAITLLVLDLKFDASAHHASLAHQLRQDWPAFAAYGVSFFQIGIIWVNHHALLSAVSRLDRVSVFYNLLLLMFVTTIPFTTTTYAAFLRNGGNDERVAVLLYGASMIGMSIGFSLLLGRLVTKDLLIQTLTPEEGKRTRIRFGAGGLVYPVSTGLGLLWPPLMLIAYLLVATYYMFDQTPILRSAPD